jgi:adenylosuccinate synthase
MPATVVVGGQWGDEGKGRIVDLLARDASIIARYSAGNNAGHTVINSLGTFKLHLVPAGIFHADKLSVIGNGVVVDPGELIAEIDALESRGVPTKNLVVSDRAHVIMPYHPVIDRLDEALRGPLAIGTTGMGVGPAFTDKVARIGIRLADLLEPESFGQRLRFVLEYKNRIIKDLYGGQPLEFQPIFDEYVADGARLAPYIRDTSVIVREALERGEKVLLEGAQGALLDLDAGTYEYVTSSVPSSTAAGASIGIGIGPTHITNVVAIYKAYTTRVGNGPMPTELFDEDGLRLREAGQEYGSTTGRPRRCGWFDAVAARYTARLNGVTSAVFTRLDVLDTFERIKVCTAYEIDGVVMENFPASTNVLSRCTPVYEEFEGWMTPTGAVRDFEDLPANARKYVRRVEAVLGAPIDLVSVGPERDQAISIRQVM